MLVDTDLRRYRRFCWTCGVLYLILAVAAAGVRWVFVTLMAAELPLGLYAQDLLCALLLACLGLLLLASAVTISRDRLTPVQPLASVIKWTSLAGGALCMLGVVIAVIAQQVDLIVYPNIVATGLALLAVLQTQSAVSALRD